MELNLVAHLVFQRYFNKAFYRFINPSLVSFSRYPVLADSDIALIKMMVTDNTSQLEKIKEEFESLSLALSGRYKNIDLEYPPEFAIEVNSSYFLYALVRLLKPINIVETGVANGHSSFFYLTLS